MTFTTYEEKQRLSEVLLENAKQCRADIVGLTERFERGEFDAQYRFYHQSFKVYSRKTEIALAVKLFKAIAPDGRQLHPWFEHVLALAMSREFIMTYSNENWLTEATPILTAWQQCLTFLRALRWSAKHVEVSGQVLSDGWALTLYLFDCR
ncbi:MAG TPA: hypothetical protein VEX70_00975 [Pyrinomonadaceae bacterium]|nr:hypothetical protein [Pyrinomonadaceae bacterium]